jgi:nucleoside-diphosphate-sugar epimerase
VEVLLQLAAAPLEQAADIFNVVDNEPARKQAIVDWLAEQLGMPAIPFDPRQMGPRAIRRASGGGLPNRRVRNNKLREALKWEPDFPDFRAGYTDILASL